MTRKRLHIRIQRGRRIDVHWGIGHYQIAGAESNRKRRSDSKDNERTSETLDQRAQPCTEIGDQVYLKDNVWGRLSYAKWSCRKFHKFPSLLGQGGTAVSLPVGR